MAPISRILNAGICCDAAPSFVERIFVGPLGTAPYVRVSWICTAERRTKKPTDKEEASGALRDRFNGLRRRRICFDDSSSRLTCHCAPPEIHRRPNASELDDSPNEATDLSLCECWPPFPWLRGARTCRRLRSPTDGAESGQRRPHLRCPARC